MYKNDPGLRVEFCETMMQRIDENSHFLHNIVFSDEATFTLHGKVNTQNWRYWSATNSHEILENHTQYPQKLNVWAGILNDRIIGPFIIDGNLNRVKYRQMLEDRIIPAIQQITRDNLCN